MSDQSTRRTGQRVRERPAVPLAGRSRPAREDRLPLSELAFDRAGAASPFGDEVQFPIETEQLTYAHPPAAA